MRSLQHTPTHKDADGTLRLQGWIAPPANAISSSVSMWVALASPHSETEYFEARPQDRPDVAATLKRTAFGFDITLDLSARPGSKAVNLFLVAEKAPYECSTEMHVLAYGPVFRRRRHRLRVPNRENSWTRPKHKARLRSCGMSIPGTASMSGRPDRRRLLAKIAESTMKRSTPLQLKTKKESGCGGKRDRHVGKRKFVNCFRRPDDVHLADRLHQSFRAILLTHRNFRQRMWRISPLQPRQTPYFSHFPQSMNAYRHRTILHGVG
jgi:hypothetical protein